MSTNDLLIRTSLKAELSYLYAEHPDAVCIDELSLLHGSCRADITIVDGVMHGYELKSDQDGLGRLPAQVDAYGVFDFATLVVGERLLNKAIEIIPDRWGVCVARVDSGRVVFRHLKLAMANSSPDPLSTVKLLWKNEALALLAESGGKSRAATLTRREWIYFELMAHVEFERLRDAVRRCLKKRRGQRLADMSPLCGG